MIESGILVMNKPQGFTSFDVIGKLRGILKMKRLGHTGTLDPDAEGVLPVCLGNGTKLCELIADRDKEYEAVTVDFHSDIDNDTFTGEAIYTNDVGDVKPGEMYNIEVKDDDKWAFSGTFRQVRVDKDGPQIVPPDMKPEKIKVTVKSKGEELIEGEAEPKGGGEKEKEE